IKLKPRIAPRLILFSTAAPDAARDANWPSHVRSKLHSSETGQCPPDLAQDLGFLLIQSKMRALKNLGSEFTAAMLAPSFEGNWCNKIIGIASPCSYRTLKRLLGLKGICVVQLEIRAQARSQELHHLRIGKHFMRSPSKFSQTLQEFFVGQIINGRLRRTEVRSWASGNK